MDFATIILLLIPIITLYVRTPSQHLTAGQAVMNLAVTVALSTTWLAGGIAAFRWYVRKTSARPRQASPAMLKVDKALALFTYGLAALFFVQVHVFYLKEAFERLFFSSEMFIVSDMFLLLPFLGPFLLFRSYAGRAGLRAKGVETTFAAEFARQTRMIGVLLIPQLLYLNLYRVMVSDVPYLSEWFEMHPAFAFVLAGTLLFLLFLLSPYCVRLLFVRVELRRFPSGEALIPHLEELARRCGTALDRVYVWLTRERKIANAAVSGVFSRHRSVFVTDHLLQTLSVPEVVAVVAHEIGHTYFGHLILNFLMALTSGVFVIWSLAGLAFVFDSVGQEELAIAVVGLEVIYIMVIFGGFARRFERQADLYAAHVTGQATLVAQALLRLAAVNHVPVSRASLTHPSIRSRVAELMARDRQNGPDLASAVRAARKRNGLVAAVMIGLILSTVFAIEYLPL